MNTARKRLLATRYRKALRTWERYMADNSCGESVLRHISGPFNDACDTLDSIREELANDPDYQEWKARMAS